MTRSMLRWSAMLSLATAALATPAVAQQPQERKGFWFNVGLGAGSLGCDDCDSRANGLSGQLSLGGTLTPRLLLGAGTNGWTKSEDGVTLDGEPRGVGALLPLGHGRLLSHRRARRRHTRPGGVRLRLRLGHGSEHAPGCGLRYSRGAQHEPSHRSGTGSAGASTAMAPTSARLG